MRVRSWTLADGEHVHPSLSEFNRGSQARPPCPDDEDGCRYPPFWTAHRDAPFDRRYRSFPMARSESLCSHPAAMAMRWRPTLLPGDSSRVPPKALASCPASQRGLYVPASERKAMETRFQALMAATAQVRSTSSLSEKWPRTAS